MRRVVRLAIVLLVACGVLMVPPVSATAQDEVKEQTPAQESQEPAKPEAETEGEKKAAAERAKAERKAVEEYEAAAESLPASAGSAECLWSGRRIASLLWRDDINTARHYMDLYAQFECSQKHLKLAFRCVIKQGPIDPKAAEELASRVHNCWIAPEGSTAAAGKN